MKFAAFLFLFVFFLSPPAAGDSALSCDMLRIGGAANYTPVSYVFEDNLTGIGPELAIELADHIRQPFTTVHSPSWARTLRRHEAGEIDLLAGLYRTTVREEGMIFIGPFMQEKTLLVTRRETPISYETWDDLKPFRGVAVIEDSRGDAFDKFARNQLAMLFVHSQEVAFNMLKVGRVDYLVVGQNTPLRDRIGDSDIVEVNKKPIATHDIYMTMSKKSPCVDLVEAISDALDKAMITGRATALVDQFMASPVQ